MKYIYLILVLLIGVGCKSHKEISTDIEYTDTSNYVTTDSVHTSTDIGYIQDINDSIVTTITERITETITDTNNVVTERVIDRVINTQRGNSITTQLNVVRDSVSVSGEDIDTNVSYKDNSNTIEKKDTEIDSIVLWIVLGVGIVVIGLIMYWIYRLMDI